MQTTNELYIVEDSYAAAQEEPLDMKYNGIACEPVEHDKQALHKCAYK